MPINNNTALVTREEEVKNLVAVAERSVWADILRKSYCTSPEEVENWEKLHEKHIEDYVQARIELDRIERSK